MKITAMLAMALLSGGSVYGRPADAAAERSATVCIEGGADFRVIVQARGIASRMFAAIGVTLDWRRGLRECPAQGIMISLSQTTPRNLLPGALAYALPYEGSHIRIFYDRICEDYQKSLVTALLAHVLVHEITHILEGVSRHSGSGLMKARWEDQDFTNMAWKPLPFADVDVLLIRRGMEGRALAMVAVNAAPVMVLAQ